MKNTILISNFLWLGSVLSAQTGVDNICISTIGSSGQSAIKSGRHYAWTTGQSVIATLSAGDFILTQGFHQPECGTVGTDYENLINSWGISAFPNPVLTELTVVFDGFSGSQLEARIYNAMGQLVVSDVVLDKPKGSAVDCTSFSGGLYFLELRDPVSEKTATLKFVKIND